MKYKVGDKVKVRQDLVVNKRYGVNTFVPAMKPYLGKIMTIASLSSRSNEYKLKEDKGGWSWTAEMLEDVDSINIVVDGNKVIAKRGNKVGIARCSPEDEFDIFIGTKLAIDRLEEKCKPYGWLQKHVVYYYPDVTNGDLYNHYDYYNDEIDKRLISRGIVFKTKEEAIEAAKKMLEVVK